MNWKSFWLCQSIEKVSCSEGKKIEAKSDIRSHLEYEISQCNHLGYTMFERFRNKIITWVMF